jgi:hypothetical protein
MVPLIFSRLAVGVSKIGNRDLAEQSPFAKCLAGHDGRELPCRENSPSKDRLAQSSRYRLDAGSPGMDGPEQTITGSLRSVPALDFRIEQPSGRM